MTETAETPAPGTITDLRDRLQRAERELTTQRTGVSLAANWRDVDDLAEFARLGGKIEGVKLALSYVEDGERIAVVAEPALAVTPAFVQRFDTEYRRMLHEQAKPLGQRDPLAAVRVYAVATVLADMLRASGVQGVPEDEPGSVLVALRDLLGMRDGQSFADAEELMHAAGAADTATLCGEPVTDGTLVAIQDWRGHVTCRACREEAEL